MTEDDSGSASGGLTTGAKTAVALVLFAMLAGLAWQTMEAGRMRTLVMVVLGAFALRLVLGLRHPRRDAGAR